jgi:hypothetical protein
MHETDIDREARLRELASKLFFTLTKEGSRFSLYREADVSQPVRHDGLSLDEVERRSIPGSCAVFTAVNPALRKPRL